MVLAFGIILFEKHGLNPGNRQLVDTVRFFSFLHKFFDFFDILKTQNLYNFCFGIIQGLLYLDGRNSQKYLHQT